MQPTFNDFQQNIELDNSDTFWLVFADYCDENDISHDIREQVSESHLESWCFELVSLSIICGFMDGINSTSDWVGSICGNVPPAELVSRSIGGVVGVHFFIGVGGASNSSGVGVGVGVCGVGSEPWRIT